MQVNIALEPNIHVTITTTRDGIQELTLKESQKGFVCTLEEGPFTKDLLAWLNSYAKKQAQSHCLPYLIEHLPLFTKKVLKYLQTLNFGTTTSYGQIAEDLQEFKAARAIGQACGRNPIPLLIPCHRVLRANQALGGFAFGTNVKKILLDFEAVK